MVRVHNSYVKGRLGLSVWILWNVRFFYDDRSDFVVSVGGCLFSTFSRASWTIEKSCTFATKDSPIVQRIHQSERGLEWLCWIVKLIHKILVVPEHC
jgi:hypothetical protein